MRRPAAVAAVCAAMVLGAACTESGSPPDGQATPTRPTATGASPTTPATGGGRPADWPTYHRDSLRTGYDPTVPPATGRLVRRWDVQLDGAVYASPLVVGDMTIAATEGGSLYGIRANRVVWRRHVGTPVPLSKLPCGNIDPLGITGTPVYDPASRTVFAVAEVDDPIRHVLVGVDPANGRVTLSRVVDPAGADPRYLQQRGALALARGFVYIPFGGLFGDCGPYIGRVIGSRADGKAPLQVFTVPTSREGGIWAPPGPVVDRSGAMYVSVGNGEATRPPYDYSDSVLRLDDRLRITSYFAPANWAEDNAADADLGSQGPTLVGNAVFIAGKGGTAYTLDRVDLGGIGHPLSSLPLCRSFGGTAQYQDVVYVPCTDGLRAVRIDRAGRMTVLWHASAGITGSPVVGGGAVFSLDTGAGRLYELDPRTGRAVTSVPTGPVSRFATPALHGAAVLVGTMSGLLRFAWD
jgi:outer membrane protein assembly factor BamB